MPEQVLKSDTHLNFSGGGVFSHDGIGLPQHENVLQISCPPKAVVNRMPPFKIVVVVWSNAADGDVLVFLLR
jgi:hypothetical protein